MVTDNKSRVMAARRTAAIMAHVSAPAAAVIPPVFAHMSKEPRLAGKTCVISGASRGFGQGIAVRFLEEGANLVLLSRSRCDETLALCARVEGADADYVAAHAVWISADIENEAGCARAAAMAAERRQDSRARE